MTEEEILQLKHERDRLLEYVMVMAGDGYTAPRTTARHVLQFLGIKQEPR